MSEFRIKCVSLPQRNTNCFVKTLGAGKAVKFKHGEVVDLAAPELRLPANDLQRIYHELLSDYPRCLEPFDGGGGAKRNKMKTTTDKTV